MRKFTAAAFVAVVIGSIALSATPASASCVYVSGTQNPLIVTPAGTVYAPGHVDVTPRDCITAVEDIIS